jgi:hypothetical protein
LRLLKVLGRKRAHPQNEDLEPSKFQLSWEIRIAELVDFFAQFGHYEVPKGYAPNPSLSNWVSMQRVRQRLGKLDRARYERLDALGFSWLAKDRHSDRCWDKRLAELRAYKQKHEHMMGEKEMGRQLLGWRNTQRVLRRKGKLSADRIARLDAIGFEWSDPRLQGFPPEIGWERRWEFFFGQLIDYKKRFGHTLVPADWRENKQLATWVAEQRKSCRRGSLNAKRQKRLEQINFEWRPPGRRRIGLLPPRPEPRYNTLWHQMFAAMQQYQDEYGHTRVSRGDADNKKLCAWRFTQQERYRQGRLSPDRIARLNSIGFEWEVPGRNGRTRTELWQARWDDMHEKLAQFHRTHGHCRIGSQDSVNAVLGRWCSKQRAAKKKGILCAERVGRLNALKFDWTPPVGLTVLKRRKT